MGWVPPLGEGTMGVTLRHPSRSARCWLWLAERVQAGNRVGLRTADWLLRKAER